LESDLDQAKESLEQAKLVAIKGGLLNEVRVLNCLVGEVIATQTFGEHVNSLLAQRQ
jgi:hypothetical protein